MDQDLYDFTREIGFMPENGIFKLKYVEKILCNNSEIPVKPPGINPEFATKIFKFSAKRNAPIAILRPFLIKSIMQKRIWHVFIRN